MVQTIKLLKRLKKQNKLTMQQYKTYRGQVLSGDLDGCLRGLTRKGFIKRRKESESNG